MPAFYRNPEGVSFALRGEEQPGCILFVEGLAEALFLQTWLKTTGASPSDIAVVCFGMSNLDTVFKNLSGDENFQNVERFGFFMDAEGRAAAGKASIVTALLRKMEIIPRGSKITAGTLLNVNGKRVALFVSPNNADPGFIEHVVMNEIVTDKFSECIIGLKNCFERISGNAANPKFLVQAYLGAYKPGLCGTGRGFDSGVLKVTHEAYAGVRNTLNGIL